jgi:hypothetical protein
LEAVWASVNLLSSALPPHLMTGPCHCSNSASAGVATRSRRGIRQSGFALVIVLAFLVLLSAAVLVFLSRSQQSREIAGSSAAQSLSGNLAEGALQAIIADLKQEISAGSDVRAQNGVNLYLPKSNALIVPAAAYSTNAAARPANVLKRSAAGVPFFSGTAYGAQHPASNLASPVSTTTASFEGKSVPRERWNVPRLMEAAEFADFPAPDWILVTRSGPRAFPSWSPALADASPANPDFVVGRFAYVIYDEGGLLDLNVAGNLLGPAENARRGPLHQADLARIPGVLDANGILAWRAAFSGTNASARPSGGGMFDPHRDFSKVQNGPAGTDQTFLSRQDLIAYALARPDQFAPDLSALPYLGTFTRSINAPTFGPVTPSGSTISYPSARNPHLADVRFTADGVLADGTEVKSGQPLLRRRFGLGRLAWITPDGPSASLPVTDPRHNPLGTAENIQSAFGLVRSSDGYSWDYRPQGGAPAAAISSLAVAAAVPREPDFFELLKAVILEGSLAHNYNDSGTFSQERDRNKDVNILQIGANLIDQYDGDDFPTLINFTNPDIASSSPDYPDKRRWNIRGVENLPYLNEIGFLPYRPVGNINLGDAQRGKLGGWFFPRLWNPHQNASAADPALRLRFVATEGEVDFRAWYGGNSPAGSGIGSGATPWTSVTTMDPAVHRITFRNSASFADPKKITSDLVDTTQTQTHAVIAESTPAVSYPAAGSQPAGVIPAGITYDLAGILLDPLDAPDRRLNPAALKYLGYTMFTFNALQAFELQFSPDGGATYFPYWRQEIKVGSGASHHGSGREIRESTLKLQAWARSGLEENGVPLTYTGFSYRSLDPRSRRLGFTNFPDATPDLGAWWNAQGGATSALTSGSALSNPQYEGYTMPRGSGFVPAGYTAADGTPRFVRGYYSVNTTSLGTHYHDPDGILRRADGDDAQDVHPTFSLDTPKTNGSAAGRVEDRPLLLNRPFRSVGEMGYAFRDTPWKTLDFFSSQSADSGLLDVFSIQENEVITGSVNLNTRQPAVLEALLAGAIKAERDATGNDSARLAVADGLPGRIARFLIDSTSDFSQGGPLANRSELATRMAASPDFPVSDAGDCAKTRREAAVRALAECGQTRTWNLLIDVIAQSGRYPAGVTAATPEPLAKFAVDGERRIWLHLAIDRFTGEILDQQWETVYE